MGYISNKNLYRWLALIGDPTGRDFNINRLTIKPQKLLFNEAGRLSVLINLLKPLLDQRPPYRVSRGPAAQAELTLARADEALRLTFVLYSPRAATEVPGPTPAGCGTLQFRHVPPRVVLAFGATLRGVAPFRFYRARSS